MLRGFAPDEVKANLDKMLTRLAERQIPVLLCGMVAAPNLGADYAERFNAIYPELAKKHGVALYPFFLEGVAATRSLQLEDGLHPNAEAVRIIVKNILPAVEKVLDQSTRGKGT
jgi:acyl-CoA thioesterase-1